VVAGVSREEALAVEYRRRRQIIRRPIHKAGLVVCLIGERSSNQDSGLIERE
jgi:hypothetical protein